MKSSMPSMNQDGEGLTFSRKTHACSREGFFESRSR